MDETLRQVVQAWLVKATHDLAAAKATSATAPDALDAAIYHCQQTAEKALKGFLALNQQPIERTHDLKKLVVSCSVYAPAFLTWMPEAMRLTPLAVVFRYPDDLSQLNPTQPEFDQALDDAQRLLDFVITLLPAEARPPNLLPPP